MGAFVTLFRIRWYALSVFLCTMWWLNPCIQVCSLTQSIIYKVGEAMTIVLVVTTRPKRLLLCKSLTQLIFVFVLTLVAATRRNLFIQLTNVEWDAKVVLKVSCCWHVSSSKEQCPFYKDAILPRTTCSYTDFQALLHSSWLSVILLYVISRQLH